MESMLLHLTLARASIKLYLRRSCICRRPYQNLLHQSKLKYFSIQVAAKFGSRKRSIPTINNFLSLSSS